jgi:MHS family proline/betaine transporter-like MFS transporter
MEETPLFLELQKKHTINRSPLKTILRFNLKSVFQIVGVLIPSTIWTYLFVFFPTYLVEKQVWKFSSSVIMNLIPAALFFLLMPIAGHISDLMGRKKIIFFGQLMLTVSAPFFLVVFDSGNMMGIACMQFVVSLFFACSYAPTAALLAEIFPTAVRNTGSSIAYHISIGLFGGITPLLLIAASSLLGTKFGPNLLLIPAGFIGMISLFTMKKTKTVLSNTYG